MFLFTSNVSTCVLALTWSSKTRGLWYESFLLLNLRSNITPFFFFFFGLSVMITIYREYGNLTVQKLATGTETEFNPPPLGLQKYTSSIKWPLLKPKSYWHWRHKNTEFLPCPIKICFATHINLKICISFHHCKVK